MGEKCLATNGSRRPTTAVTLRLCMVTRAKKLNFMGNEIGQSSEWNHDASVDWRLLDFDKHQGIQRLYRDLNHLYKALPALHQRDHEPAGFDWIDLHNHEQSVFSFVRHSLNGTQ